MDPKADPTALSLVTEPLYLIFSTLFNIPWSRWLSRLAHLIALPLRALLLPLAILGRILLVLLSPVLSVLSYLLGIVAGVLSFVASLEPLYTFFGVAAFIGIITGLILSFSSSFLTTQLQLHDTPSDYKPKRSSKTSSSRLTGKAPQRYLEYQEDEDDSSAEEVSYQFLDTSPSPIRRRQAAGLLSQTILEEEDSSDAAAAAAALL